MYLNFRHLKKNFFHTFVRKYNFFFKISILYENINTQNIGTFTVYEKFRKNLGVMNALNPDN